MTQIRYASLQQTWRKQSVKDEDCHHDHKHIQFNPCEVGIICHVETDIATGLTICGCLGWLLKGLLY